MMNIKLNKQTIHHLDAVAKNNGITRQDLVTSLVRELSENLTTDELLQASKNINVLFNQKQTKQIDIMLGLLQTHGKITTKKAKTHGLDNPGYLIHQLRMKGHVITDRWAKKDVPNSKNHKIYTYNGQSPCTQFSQSC